MKSINTVYNGCLFRSRLEARWAIFFDACSAKWQYEPEGFDLGNGICYLPDFLLHDVLYYDNDKMDLYVEVKGKMTHADAEKIRLFEEPVLVLSDIPRGENIDDIDRSIWDIYEGDESLFPYYGATPFNSVSICGNNYPMYPGIDKQGKFALFSPSEPGNRDDILTEKAYRLARQARFEYGQNVFIKRQRILEEYIDKFFNKS